MGKQRGIDECSVPQRLRGPGWAQHDLDTHRNAEWKANQRRRPPTDLQPGPVEAFPTRPLIELTNALQVGRVTAVTVRAVAGDREYTAGGASACDQHDEPDGELGMRLAIGRAVTDLGRQIKHEAWRDVQRQPKPEAPVAGEATVRVRVNVELVREREQASLAVRLKRLLHGN